VSPRCSRRSVLKGAGVSLAMLGIPDAMASLSAAELESRYDYKHKARIRMGVELN
jgi:hypothetical protein